jgi:hypothetical protein
MLSILMVLAVALVVTGIGWSVVARLDSGDRLSGGEKIVFSFLTGGYAIYFGVFFIGLVRLDVLTMSGLALVCVLAAIPGLRAFPWKSIFDFYAGILRAGNFSTLLLIAVIAVAASSLLQGLAPPNDYDSLLYHLSIPLYDIEIGRIVVPNDARGAQALFPAMTSNLTRFLLVFTDGETAQIAHGTYGIAVAAGAGLVGRRFGYGINVALIAALFFLVIRGVVWQMASAETDIPLATFTVAAFISYLAWRQHRVPGLGVLFGLMIGGMILTKYTGFAVALSFGALVVYDMAKAGKKMTFDLIGPAVAMFVILPHMIRNIILADNPVFPLFNSVFNPDNVNPYGSVAGELGTGRGLIDFLTAPWNIFIVPMQYFDGMVVGAPYLLAFIPFAFLDRERRKQWVPLFPACAIYFLIWFFVLTHQVRFLMPLMPLMAAMAAAGTAIMWQRVRGNNILVFGFVAVIAILGLNQIMFVGVYAALRLPTAIGFMSKSEYHAKTPTMNGAYYDTCSYITDNLKPGETYYSGIAFPSYYCPQANVAFKRFLDEGMWILGTGVPAKYSHAEFVNKLEKANFRYMILVTGYYSRRDRTTGYKARENISARTIKIPTNKLAYRFKEYLAPAIKNIKPLIRGPNSNVYDGAEVLEAVKRIKPRS